MIRIVTDSTANLSPEIAKRYGITVIPLRVILGGVTYRDGVDISPTEFYRLLVQSKDMATTSQPPAIEFETVFRELTANGDEVLTILISSKLSGTVASAVAAQRQLPESKITVYDSLVTAGPMAMMVQHASEMIEKGASKEDILRDLNILRDRCKILFIVDTLKYLQKGGRIGGAAALAGTILNIKPVLTLSGGTVDVWAKLHGKQKALQTVIDSIRDTVGSGSSLRTIVLHADAIEDARKVISAVKEQLDCPEPLLADLTPVIGAHAGPGLIGLCAYNQDWLYK